MTDIRIGVLGIQGAFAKHAEVIAGAGVEVCVIKYREQLEHIDGLIIPGGESTAMTKMFGFRIDENDLRFFGKSKPVFGTCAGLILIGSASDDPRVRPLELMDVRVDRNAYGSQKESFVEDITLDFDRTYPFPAIFIRAPRVVSFHPDIRVLSHAGNTPVLLESRLHLGASFHPELTADKRIHQYFVQKVKEIKNGEKKHAS
ncbi:MAG: pyridoxal 5'-phosphate synthase glutaminase subunit PdxT [FCB group bacterium]|nr:pyridoxal 5'-phosphate synthase glutaminase subunit PdxT [FCB group bacterium]